MIVQFNTDTGRISMHGEPAVQLLKLMGHSGSVPGAIRAEDLPASLQALRKGLETAGDTATPTEEPAPDADEEDEEERAPPVSLRTRAVPLLEMLEAAIKDGSGLMWDRA